MRIAYFMHIPWGWAKQRPHFIAEQLAHCYIVNVISQKEYKIKSLQKAESRHNLRIVQPLRIPFSRFVVVRILNKIIFDFTVKLNLARADIAWFTDPRIYKKICGALTVDKTIVYDCMDNVVEFNLPNLDKRELHAVEEELCKRAKIILCSSVRLSAVLVERYGSDLMGKICIVNNALDESLKEKAQHNTAIEKKLKELKKIGSIVTYVGTISDWFDFELLIQSVDRLPNIQYCIFGPTDVKLPTSKNIHYFGALQHDNIWNIMRLSDLMVMPFIVNELIESVDAVKMYEYIASGTPVLAVDYHENRKFAKFAYLYRDAEEYISMLSSITAEPRMRKNILTSEEIEKFTANNTWKERIKDIFNLINSVYLNQLLQHKQ